uniref:Uncharacterized protein n=1 Tax=Glossina austeni TaxID=7395 RepID=A0A1A9UUM5_GLOAU
MNASASQQQQHPRFIIYEAELVAPTGTLSFARLLLNKPTFPDHDKEQAVTNTSATTTPKFLSCTCGKIVKTLSVGSRAEYFRTHNEFFLLWILFSFAAMNQHRIVASIIFYLKEKKEKKKPKSGAQGNVVL